MVQGGPFVQLGIIVLTVFDLWVGARLLVDSVVRLARRFGLSDLTIGLTVVGIVGLAALVRPLAVSPSAIETLAWLAVISVLLVAALWTERVLSRMEGALFTSSEVLRWIAGIVG